MLAEARIVAGVGVVLGLLASLATIVPFGVARHEGLVPDGQLWLPAVVVGGVVALTLLSARVRGPPYRSRGAVDRRSRDDRLGRDGQPAALLQPIRSVRPAPVDGDALVDRLRLTAVSLGYALLMAPALALGILTILAIPLGLITVGFAIALARGAGHRGAHRRSTAGSAATCSASRSPRRTPTRPAPTVVTRPLRWLTRQGALAGLRVPVVLGDRRLRDVDPAGRRCWSRRSRTWSAPCSTAGCWWWLLVAARRAAPARLVVRDPGAGPRPGRWPSGTSSARGRVEELERRVEEVTTSRTETLDHSAAEVRRIERDLHDGAQARIASVGMNVGLAEKLMATDPEAAAALLREARETTVERAGGPALGRARHPPAGAGRPRAGRRHRGARAADPAAGHGDRGRAVAPAAGRVGGVLRGRRVPGQHGQARRTRPGPGCGSGTTARCCTSSSATTAGAARTRPAPVWPGWRSGSRRSTARWWSTAPTGGPTVVTMEVPCRTSPS